MKMTLLTLVALSAIVIIACGGTPTEAKSFEINVYQTGGTIDGPRTTLDDVLAQGKPVVLNFWGGNCPPCREEMPLLDFASKEFADEMILLGVDIGPFTRLGTHQQAQSLLREVNVDYPAGNTEDGGVMEDFNVTGLPLTVFIQPDGTITDTWPGAISWTQLERRVEDLIESSAE